MKITYVTADPTISHEQIKKLNVIRGSKVERLNRKKMSSEEVIETLKDSVIVIGGSSGFEYMDRNVFEKLPKLKLISVLGVGTEWINVKDANEFGISVCNAKGANAESVAEHVWGMILSLSKKISEADKDIRYKDAFKFIDYEGMELFGKTIGIVGLGEIGSRVATIASALNMEVIGVNNSGKKVKGVRLVSLDELLNISDVIILCVPQSKETENMISDSEVKKMKDGVILVSSSRENLINQKAVVKALGSGKIFGFGQDLDIMRKIDPKDLLLGFPNVILTPHSAFFTKESENKTDDVAIDNVIAYINGKPINLVK